MKVELSILKIEEDIKTKIKSILFDLGDTLHDRTNCTRFARRTTLDSLIDQGVPIADIEKMEKSFDKIIEDHAKPHADRFFLNANFFDKLFKQENLRVDAWQPALALATYRDIVRFLVRPSTVVISTLSELKRRGYVLGLITDGSIDSTNELTLRLGITKFFHTKVISEEVGVEKPDSLIFKEALRRLNSKAPETMIVGDNLERDVRGGKLCGLVTALMQRYLRPEPSPAEVAPDYRIFRIDELLDIL
jgi:putative hydrolase of the HAD superfamily